MRRLQGTQQGNDEQSQIVLITIHIYRGGGFF